MHLNGWKRWLLPVGFALLWMSHSRAQSGQRTLSELDRLPVWHPLYRPVGPAFQESGSTSPTAYASVGDLLRKAGAGSKIESLVLTGDVLKPGGLPDLRRLRAVRVLTVTNLTQQQADSVFEFIQDWPLLERLTVYSESFNANKTEPNQLVALSARVGQLPKLHDVRLSGNLNWDESMRTLAGLKTLRYLDLNSWQSAKRQPVNLGQLRQLTGLKIHGSNWLIQPETFAALTQLTELSLSSIQVDTLTFGRLLTGLTNLETLTINNVQQLRKLVLGGLKQLKSVELQYNPDLVVDEATLVGLTGLERLVIQGYRSADLSGLCPLTNLRVLTLSGNGANKQSFRLPDCIGQLRQLGELRIFDAVMGPLPASFGSLSKLKHLTLLGCGLDSVPASFGQLTALEELFLNRNKLRQAPGIGQLRALRQLSISDNQLTALPDDIGQLTQLTSLNVDRNKLTQLPASLSRLVNLSNLSLSDNQLERLPDAMGNLRKLHSLTIGNNQLTALPNSMGQLDSLRSLVIGKNRLRTLPATLSRWKSLTNLSIGDNQLTALPNDIGALGQLTSLWIQTNPITELPASITELVNLQSLTVYGTRVRLLPDHIGALTKLRHVSLGHNELIALPNSIGQWQEVETLSLEWNKLEGLPNAVGRLTKLAALTISGREKVGEEAVGGLQQLPDSIINCTRLRQLTIRQQPQLDADDVFTKAARIKGLTNLTIANCNVSRLPPIAWKNVAWENLDVSQNLLTELPVDVLDAPKLQFLTTYENRLPDVLNRSFSDKDALRVAFADVGVLPLANLGKPNRKVGMAYQQMASQKARQRDWDGALNDLQKAIDYMPDTTLALPYAQRAELHFYRKEYNNALVDYDKAITCAPQLRKEKHGDSLMANRILTSFWQRKATILGAMGKVDEALAAITQAESALPASDNSPLSGQIYTERGRYLALKGNLADADSSYNKAIRAYEKLPYAQPGIRLTIVELGLLTGQYDRAQRAMSNLPADQMRGENEILKEYLDVCLAVLRDGQPGTQTTERLKAYLAKHPAKIYGWSFDLFDNWLAKAKLPTEKINALRQLTDMTRERLVRPQ